jgi:hypothetical protein
VRSEPKERQKEARYGGSVSSADLRDYVFRVLWIWSYAVILRIFRVIQLSESRGLREE